ncbi:hypothetical protein H480_10860, partial [Amycolatopsis vancoresmycina DSM 44592]
MVARWSETARSHRAGSRRKLNGDISVTGKPANTGCRIPPISPMSWYGGSQITPRLSAVCPNRSRMKAELCSRLACVITTPLGCPVEPEVYCRNAIRSALCRTPGRAPAAGAVSVASHAAGTP